MLIPNYSVAMMIMMMRTRMKETEEPKVRLRNAKCANQASDLANHATVHKLKRK